MKLKTSKLFILILIFISFNSKSFAQAEELKINDTDSDISVLVIFSSEDNNINENQRLMDLAIGHFTKNITFKSSNDLEKQDLKNHTHLIYYGHNQEELPSTIAKAVSSFKGPIMAIGHNVEQLGDKYKFVETKGEQTISEVKDIENKKEKEDIEPQSILEPKVNKKTTTIIEGSGEHGTFPIIMNNDKEYYVAFNKIIKPFSTYFSQSLFKFFDKEQPDKTPAYIRLEDVHPLVDPDKLRAIAKELKERNIPYMIAVIPVYTDPETKKRYHFEDRPEILSILKYMQNNGGSVVLHGYTHQFRDNETGEGFEFWDVKNQMPIYHGPKDKVNKKERTNFSSQKAFEKYEEENKAYEREYIEDRLTKGIEELSNYGIYPLAFEAPHYTMSQHGYTVTSDFFSTYAGQIQLSDEDWEIMDTTPYSSNPSFLNNMLLLPETIGFVDGDDPEAIDKMMDEVRYYKTADGALLGGFYHPYLGIDDFKKLMDEMESIPNTEWIDLKKIDNTVQTDNVTITSEDGEIHKDIDTINLFKTSFKYPLYHMKKTISNTTWVIAAVSIFGVVIFIIFIISQVIRKHIRQTKNKRKEINDD